MDERTPQGRHSRAKDPWKWDPGDEAALGLEPDSIDPGEPVKRLQALQDPASGGLFRRVRSSIDRRVFASQAADLAIPCVIQTLIEYLSMAFSLFERSDTRPTDRRRRDTP